MSQMTFPNKDSLRKWLVGVGGVLLTSISLIGDVQKLEVNFSRPKVLAEAMSNNSILFPEGQYLIDYEDSDEEDEIDYSKMVMAISIEAKLNGRDILIGGFKQLIVALSDFDFSYVLNKEDNCFYTAGFWIVEPKSPVDIDGLKDILSKYSVMYAFNDGSGFVTLNNARMGRGIQNIVHL